MNWFKEYKKLIFSQSTSIEKIEEAMALKFKNLPQILYKYREVNENSLKNLEEDTVWLSDPKNFNDPYDCSFKMKDQLSPFDPNNVIDTAIQAGLINLSDSKTIELIKNSNKPMTTLMEKCYPDQPEHGQKIGDTLSMVLHERGLNLISEASNGFKQIFKVCAFSEKPNSILMWSHYANYHKGFCIAYNFQELGNEDMRTRSLCPVMYSDKIFDATKIFDKNKKQNNILYINQAALLKSKEWSYEKEWRLVFGNMVLQKEISFKVPVPKFVLLGTKISEPNEKLIRDICDKKNIEVKQMKMSPVKYELSF